MKPPAFRPATSSTHLLVQERDLQAQPHGFQGQAWQLALVAEWHGGFEGRLAHPLGAVCAHQLQQAV